MATNKKLNKITVLNQSKKSPDLPVQQNRILEKVVDETVSISKPTGVYINIAKILNLNNEEFNGYKSSIRDLIEAYIDVETSWEKQERRAILKIIEKVSILCPPKKTKEEGNGSYFKKNKSVITRDKIKNKVVISSSGTADDLSDKSDNNDNNTDNTNTNVSGKSGKKKNERKKSGRISNQPRKDYNENNKR
ncbi:unnamed protein product [Rhizophagus irregularis]|nr:unnamed protein product [Rhizophagus irregularis]